MISHHHKCVFIHIPKNAGQSIENLFIELLNLTWETRAPLLLRPNDCLELGPTQLAHLKSDEYIKYKYMTPEQYDTYFTFAFVRNPWERVVSMYKYLDYSKRCSFKDFVNDVFLNKLWKEKYWFVCPQVEYIYKNKMLNVDFIGRFENLQEDFDYICTQIDLPATNIPHKNKSSEIKKISFVPRVIRYLLNSKNIRKALDPKRIYKKSFPGGILSKGEHHKKYQQYYDQNSKKIIDELYREDIETFKYTFD